MDARLPDAVDDLLVRAGHRFRDRIVQAERQHQRAIADRSWQQIRPWFYDDFAIHPIADPAVRAALRGEALPCRLERRVCWHLIRMFARRLRHSDRHPSLSQASRTALQIAIRCELRRLANATRQF